MVRAVNESLDFKTKNMKTLEHVTRQGDVEPEGTSVPKKGSDLDVKGGNAQNRKQLNKVEAGGVDAAKRSSKMKSGDHFKASTTVEPSGTEAGKAGAGRNVG